LGSEGFLSFSLPAADGGVVFGCSACGGGAIGACCALPPREKQNVNTKAVSADFCSKKKLLMDLD
jgi:hypothetical protein